MSNLQTLPPHVAAFIRNQETSTACLISIERMLAEQHKPRLGFFGWLGVLFVVLVIGSSCAKADPQQTILRDASGRTIGTVSRDSPNQDRVRDAQGRTTGTVTYDSQGNATFRDAQGRTTGSASHPRR